MVKSTKKPSVRLYQPRIVTHCESVQRFDCVPCCIEMLTREDRSTVILAVNTAVWYWDRWGVTPSQMVKVLEMLGQRWRWERLLPPLPTIADAPWPKGVICSASIYPTVGRPYRHHIVWNPERGWIHDPALEGPCEFSEYAEAAANMRVAGFVLPCEID